MIVIALALASAALAALSAAGEQRAASRLARKVRQSAPPPAPGATADPRRQVMRRRLRHGLGFAFALLTTPLWLASWVVDGGSFVLQAAALHLGSLSVVQPLMVTTLLFSIPLAALGTGRRPSLLDWVGAVAVCGGLVLVLSTRGSSGIEVANHATLIPAVLAVLLLAALLVVLARGRSAPVGAAMLAVSAGVLFSVGAAVTKLTTATAVDGGFVGLLTSWPGYALAAVSLVSFSLQQAAYARGPLAPAMTAIVIADPLTSYLLGVVGFGEPLPAPGAPLALAALGMGVLITGIAVLAHSPLLRPADAGERPASAPPTRASASTGDRGDGVPPGTGAGRRYAATGYPKGH
ncbi:DMT family transporter [Pseudonocardia hispaniensis]|uniref:DMT family transporter n=1 Tax=Pseudonocardia hispaniensis TaxID=904933 RepID=A0ABW1J802_9PSEU